MNTPIEILEKLSAQTTEKTLNEKDLRATDGFDSAEWDEAEKLWEEFLLQYRETVESISSVWGPPEFEGGYEDDGFPEWYPTWVPHLAYWRRESGCAYVVCDQQDQECPIILTLGVWNGNKSE